MSCRLSSWFARLAWLLAFVLAGVWPAYTGLAQDEKELSQREKSRLQALGTGKEAMSPNDKELLQKAAKFHLHRLTEEKYQRKATSETPGINQLLERDTFPLIPVPTEKKPLTENQQEFLQAFTDALLPAINEALHNPEPIVQVNAARILARLGEAGQEKSADDMVKVLQDKSQSDAVKVYALKGLAELFAAAPGATVPGKRALKDEEREDKCILALVEFLERKPNLSKNAPLEEVDAFRYLRREAIRALGKTRTPAVMKKKQFVGTPTALALLRVVSNDGVKPPPSIYEQVEAAVAVCQLQTPLVNGYQPDYAAHVIGELILAFTNEYNHNKAQAVAGSIPTWPWKYLAAMMLDAVKSWKATNPNDNYIADLEGKSVNVLKTIQNNAGAPALGGLQAWLQKPAPHTSLFKGNDKSVVKPAAPAEN